MPKLKIIAAQTFKRAAERVVEILQQKDPRDLDTKHIIIVPDRTSFETERQLIEKLGGSFNVSVLTFRRFASKILPQNAKYLTKKGAIMALTGIIAAAKGQMSCFEKGCESANFAQSVYEVICTLKYNRILPQSLSAAALPKSLRPKIADIALLYSRYQQFLLDTNSQDSASKLEELVQAVQSAPDVKNTYFYFFDFDNFSAQEDAVITNLIKCARGVTVACPHSANPSHKYLYLNEIYNQMLAAARRAGTVAEIENLPESGGELQLHIAKNLYSYAPCQKLSAGEAVVLRECADAGEELTLLAEEISRFVRGGGRFGDVYIVCSEIAPYSAAAQLLFARYNIPLFIDERQCLCDHALCRYLLDFLTLSRQNASLESTLPFVKNHFFAKSCEPQAIFEFENFCLKYNVSYDFSAFKLGAADANFARADIVRQILFQKVSQNVPPPSATAASYVNFCRTFLHNERAEAALSEFASLLNANNLSAEAAATEQVWEKLTDTLDELERVLGRCELSLELFTRVLSQGLAAVTISLVPQRGDTVVLTNMARARKHDIKVLALLGAAQNKMPIVKKDTKLLSDKNISDLAVQGIELSPKMSIENKRERFSLYQLLQEFSQKLFVSVSPAAGEADAPLAPSDFFINLQEIFQNCNGDGGENEPRAHFFTRKTALAALAESYSNGGYAQNPALRCQTRLEKLLENDIPPQIIAQKNYAGENAPIDCGEQLFLDSGAASVSKIEDFYACPMRHFYNYGLRLKERKTAALRPLEFGNILHEILERFVGGLKTAEDFEAAKINARVELCFNAVFQNDFYRSILQNVLYAPAVAALKDEARKMCRETARRISCSLFKPYALEAVFGKEAAGGENSSAFAAAFSAHGLKITGKIDRIDVYGDYFIIIDYKTGYAAFSEKLLYFGRKIQLPLYVAAIEQKLGKKCAGYYYFLVNDKLVAESAATKKNAYIGRTVRDADLAAALDCEFAATGKSASFGFRAKKDGDFYASPALVSQEELNAQVSYSKLIMHEAAGQMRRGVIASMPCENACDNCQSQSICDFGDTYSAPARQIRQKISAADILEIANSVGTVQIECAPPQNYKANGLEDVEYDDGSDGPGDGGNDDGGEREDD